MTVGKTKKRLKSCQWHTAAETQADFLQTEKSSCAESLESAVCTLERSAGATHPLPNSPPLSHNCVQQAERRQPAESSRFCHFVKYSARNTSHSKLRRARSTQNKSRRVYHWQAKKRAERRQFLKGSEQLNCGCTFYPAAWTHKHIEMVLVQ